MEALKKTKTTKPNKGDRLNWPHVSDVKATQIKKYSTLSKQVSGKFIQEQKKYIKPNELLIP